MRISVAAVKKWAGRVVSLKGNKTFGEIRCLKRDESDYTFIGELGTGGKLDRKSAGAHLDIGGGIGSGHRWVRADLGCEQFVAGARGEPMVCGLSSFFVSWFVGGLDYDRDCLGGGGAAVEIIIHGIPFLSSSLAVRPGGRARAGEV